MDLLPRLVTSSWVTWSRFLNRGLQRAARLEASKFSTKYLCSLVYHATRANITGNTITDEYLCAVKLTKTKSRNAPRRLTLQKLAKPRPHPFLISMLSSCPIKRAVAFLFWEFYHWTITSDLQMAVWTPNLFKSKWTSHFKILILTQIFCFYSWKLCKGIRGSFHVTSTRLGM